MTPRDGQRHYLGQQNDAVHSLKKGGLWYRLTLRFLTSERGVVFLTVFRHPPPMTIGALWLPACAE
jgi:hypothetical protein